MLRRAFLIIKFYPENKPLDIFSNTLAICQVMSLCYMHPWYGIEEIFQSLNPREVKARYA